MRVLFVLTLALELTGCGTPQRLPVDVPRCDAMRTPRGAKLTAAVTSRATKPINGLSFTADFYHDFRSATVTWSATVRPELDPGQQRDIVSDASGAPLQADGRAMKCAVSRVSYLDGTSESVVPPR